MNVLFITPYYYPNIVGGAEISVQLIAEGLAGRGHNVTVLTMDETNNEYYRNNVKIITVHLKGLSTAWKNVIICKKQSIAIRCMMNNRSFITNNKLLKFYKELLSHNRYDVAVMNSNEECFGRASLWKSLNDMQIPSILTFRDPLLLEKHLFGIKLDKIYQKFVIKQTKWINAYVAPSLYMKKIYSGSGFLCQNAKIIYNAVDVPVRRYEPELKKKRVLFAGSIVEKKGIKTLIKAMKIVNNHQDTPIEILLVGKGNMVKQLSGIENVKIIDWLPRTELYKIMSESLVVVLPSEWPEAFGRIIVESVFNGTLAVGSTSGAIPEILKSERQYIFNTGDENELAHRINSIINMSKKKYEEEIERMQVKFNDYSIEKYVDNWEMYIKDVITEFDSK